MCRQSPVKPEGILIQIISQVFLGDCSLMGTHQPPFDQRDDKMYMGQQLGGIFFALGNILDNMLIIFFFQRDVTEPPICNNTAVGHNLFRYERDQAIGRSVRNYPESYSAKFLFLNFNGNNHQSLRFRFTPPNIFLHATDKGFVDLNRALKPISTRANHCTPKFMQPSPCGLIPPKPHGMLQILCTGSGLLRHHPPHHVESQAKWFARPFKNCTSSDRGLMPTFGTDQKRTFAFPRPIAMATRAYKTLGPTQTHYIIITILLCCEFCYKLFKIFWIILKLHNLPSISKCMAGILHVVVTGGKRIPS